MANIITNLMGGMTMEKLSGVFSSAAKDSGKITENLQKANGFASKLGASMKGMASSAAGFGQKLLGAGGLGNVMSNSLGSFGGFSSAGASMTNAFGSGNGSLEEALKNLISPPKTDPMVMYQGVMSGVQQFMPDVKATVGRAASYYNATMYSGNRFPRATSGLGAMFGMPSVEDMTFKTLASTGGITGVGSDANVAKYLTGRGMNVSNQYDSTYQQTLRTIGNAGKYMNISNEAAAQSIEGLTSAEGSSNMLRKFGIYTSDLETGKEKTQTEIFEELYGRITAGRPQMSIEDTNASFRRGFGATILKGAFGNDQAGAEMFKQFAIDKAGGTNLDLSDQAKMSKLYGSLGSNRGGAQGNENPLMGLMQMNSSDTAQLDKAEESYLAGMHAAVPALQALNEVAGTLAATLGGVTNGFMTMFQNSTTAKGLGKSISSYTDFMSANASESLKAALPHALTGDFIGAAAAAAPYALNVTTGNVMLAATAGTGLVSTVVTGGLDARNRAPINEQRNPNNEDKKLGGGEALPSGGGEALPSSSGGAMAAPIPGGQVVKGADFNDRTGVYFKTTGRPHMGKDYQASEGSPVYAVTGGKVVKAEGNTKRIYIGTEADRRKSSTVYDGIESDKTFSLGLQVHVLHPSGYKFIYGHLSQISSKVKQAAQSGGEISKNDLIGLSGHSGSTTGPHLHFEVQDKNGTKVNPKTVIDKLNAQANLTGGAAGSTGSAAGSTGSTGSAGAAGSVNVGSALSQATAGAQSNAMTSGFFGASPSQIQSMYQGLMSGNMEQMQAAVAQMVQLSGGGKAVSSATANTPGTGANTAKGSGNNVNITLQLPDVSESEASKFAKLVKQYLDDGTLQSNMGSY